MKIIPAVVAIKYEKPVELPTLIFVALAATKTVPIETLADVLMVKDSLVSNVDC